MSIFENIVTKSWQRTYSNIQNILQEDLDTQIDDSLYDKIIDEVFNPLEFLSDTVKNRFREYVLEN